MFRPLMIALLLILSKAFIATAAPDKQKIAIVEVQRILERSSAIRGIRETIDKINEDLQIRFQQTETELKNVETQLLQKKNKLSPENFDKELKVFQEKVNEAQQQAQEEKIKLEQAYADSISKINEVALKLISDIAFEKGVEIVLPNTQVLFFHPNLNITEEVLIRLNAKVPSLSIKF